MTTREKSSGTAMTEPRTTELTLLLDVRGNVTPEQWGRLTGGDPTAIHEAVHELEALFADRLTAHAVVIHHVRRVEPTP